MKRRGLVFPLLSAGVLALASGCSSYDPHELEQASELQALSARWAGERAHPGSILLAPIAAPSLAPPKQEDLRGLMRCEARALEREVLLALERVVGEGRRVALAPQGVDPAAFALAEGYEVVLRVEVTRWNASFVETTGWWYPNALFIGWYFWPVGAWTIADEVYGLDCALSVSLLDAASERPVGVMAARTIQLESGPEPSRPPNDEEVAHLPRITLSDGERGLDFFGTWAPGELDPEQWDEVGLLLEPYARRYASVRVAAAVAKALEEDRGLGSRDERYATAHGVVVGLGEYGEEPCPGAREDGEAFAGLLRGVAPVGSGAVPTWLPKKNLQTFWGGQASVADVRSAARAAASRARPEDTLVFTFAGRGRTRADAGQDPLARLELVCANGGLSLAELADAFAGCVAKRRLIVIDADFKGGGPRGEGEPPPASALAPALQRLLLQSELGAGVVVLACDPASGDRAQVYDFGGETRGLLSRYLLLGLASEADRGGDGVSAGDLALYLERHVGNLSEVALERPQHPLVVVQNPGALLYPGGRAPTAPK